MQNLKNKVLHLLRLGKNFKLGLNQNFLNLIKIYQNLGETTIFNDEALETFSRTEL